MSLFFKPTDGWAADFIPFYWNDKYRDLIIGRQVAFT